ncbi:alpha/Beta hydrolase fold protein [Artemisia annua]|uniref:Alpha/Beta hydrolase fold protein n=1 Tax=Artemisia annua TaxID=35608 RepID=A0A2U1PSI5_ARTAN|nr:alpha/Beta hydrolase fold protein [Artemisia annua]
MHSVTSLVLGCMWEMDLKHLTVGPKMSSLGHIVGPQHRNHISNTPSLILTIDLYHHKLSHWVVVDLCQTLIQHAVGADLAHSYCGRVTGLMWVVLVRMSSKGYNNGTGIISPFMPQALFDDIFSRLLALTSYIRNRFIQFFEDLVYRDVSRFSEDFVALSSCQDLSRCASTPKNLGTVLDERTQEPSSIEDHSSLLSRCEIIERKFFYGVLVYNFRLDLARYFVKSTLLLALAPYQISSQCVKHAQICVKSTLSRVQITFHGSSADIGWIQRDPTMDPVKDGSDRFAELLNAIRYFQHLHKSPIKLGMLKQCSVLFLRNGEHKLPDSYVYLLIPGLFSNHGPLYFVSTKRFFSKMGLACHIAKIHSEASVEYNSLVLKQYIEELYWGSGKRVMLLGHSKGGVDAAAALSLYWSDLKGKVAGLALVQSPYGGTPIASDIMREGQIADKETRRIMRLIVCKIIKGDIKSLEDLTYEKRKQFLSQHKLPKGIPLISFRSEANVGPGVISMMSHIAHVELPKLSFLGNMSDESEYKVGPAEKHRVPLVVPVSAALAVSALHLQLRYGEKSDGLVTCRDAEVPGSVVMESHPDHNDDASSDHTYEASSKDEDMSGSWIKDLEEEDCVEGGEADLEWDIEDDNECAEHTEKGKSLSDHDPSMEWKEMKPVLGERDIPGRPSVKTRERRLLTLSYFLQRRGGCPGGHRPRGRDMKVKSKNCLEKGHNKKSCTKERKIPPPKEPKKKARPRLNQTREVTTAVGRRGGRGGSFTPGMGVYIDPNTGESMIGIIYITLYAVCFCFTMLIVLICTLCNCTR